MVKTVTMSYIHFYEFAMRYLSMAEKKIVPKIKYQQYRKLKEMLGAYNLVNDSFYSNNEYVELCHYSTSNSSEVNLFFTNDIIEYLDIEGKEFFNTLENWESEGYPFTLAFIPSFVADSYRFTFAARSPRTEKKEKIIEKKEKIKNNCEREEMIMKTNNFFNFEFGVVKDYAIAMSPFGLAVKNSTDGAFQAYDKTTGNVVNVDGFTFKINGAFFKMPVAIDSIQIGDMLMVNGSPVYVIGKDVVGVAVIDLKCSEKKTIMPTTNIFGFNYMTKVVSMFDNFCGFGNTAPSKEQPFGNLAPLMMMQMFTGDDNDFDFDFNGDMGKMMMMSMMMGGQNPFMNMFGAAPIPTPTVNTDAIKRQAVNAGKAMRGIVSDSVEIDPNFQTPNLVGLGGVDIPDGTNIEVKMTKATTQN